MSPSAGDITECRVARELDLVQARSRGKVGQLQFMIRSRRR